jgi:peptidoglycan/LPS O-acetylase OafA/YrhL
MSSKSFFRWKPVSISLIVLAVFYWGVALLNFWLVHMLQQKGDIRNVRFLLWGSFWDVVIGALCLGGRRRMKSPSRQARLAGALAIGLALLIEQCNWLAGLMTGRSGFPVLEALLIWPCMAYAVAYAVTQVQEHGAAELGAPPNGGPAEPLSSSSVIGGPPSVS